MFEKGRTCVRHSIEQLFGVKDELSIPALLVGLPDEFFGPTQAIPGVRNGMRFRGSARSTAPNHEKQVDVHPQWCELVDHLEPVVQVVVAVDLRLRLQVDSEVVDPGQTSLEQH